MKEFLSGTNRLKINLYFIHVLVFVLSFQERVIPLILIVFMVFNLVTIPWSTRVHFLLKRQKYIWSFISLYLVSVFGMLYTLNLSEGWFDLEVKLSILLAPLLVLTSNVINRYNVYSVIKSFIWGVTLSLSLQFLIAVMTFYEFGNPDVFFYELLSFFHHPAYFSMYINFAIACLLILIFHFRNRPQFRHFLLLGFLVIGVYQLSSRAGFLTLMVLLLYTFVYIIFPRLKWKKMLYALFATLILVASILYPVAKYTDTLRAVDISTSQSSSGVRLAMWKSAIPVMLENPIIGVGTGDVNRELQQQFAKDRIVRAVRDNLNAHNQFIQTQVALGIIGSFALMWGLLFPVWVSIKKGRFLYPLFVVVLLINFLTESVFNTQAGVIYFSLLNSVVFFTYED